MTCVRCSLIAMTSELLRQVSLHGAIPRHIGIIMDCNGRWDRGKGLPRSAGHRQGINAVCEVIEGVPGRAVRCGTRLPGGQLSGSL
jgi:undecaprenyl pyrophosphate synthase